MKRKVLAAIIAMSMLMTGLTGCGSSAAGNAQEGGSASAGESAQSGESIQAEASESFNKEGYPIVNEPLTLNVMFAIRDVDSMIEPNDMKVVQDLEAKTGIHIEWEMIKGTDWETKLNLMFASGGISRYYSLS